MSEKMIHPLHMVKRSPSQFSDPRPPPTLLNQRSVMVRDGHKLVLH